MSNVATSGQGSKWRTTTEGGALLYSSMLRSMRRGIPRIDAAVWLVQHLGRGLVQRVSCFGRTSDGVWREDDIWVKHQIFETSFL